MYGQFSGFVLRLDLLGGDFLCIRLKLFRSWLSALDFLFRSFCRSSFKRLYELGIFEPLRDFLGSAFREVFFDSTLPRHSHDNLVFWLVLFTGHQISPPIRA